MINWVIGGLIIGLTVFSIVNWIRRLRKGETGCAGCSGCEDNCNCKEK